MIIDTDTASDDAVAILMAHRYPQVEVMAVTVVSGICMCGMGHAMRGIRWNCAVRETPVYVGCDRPLLREPVHAVLVSWTGWDGWNELSRTCEGGGEGHASMR